MNPPDTLPPSCYAIEDERFLLSYAMNVDPAAIVGLKFYNPVHQDLAHVITRMADDGATVELVTVSSAVRTLPNATSLTNLVNDIMELAITFTPAIQSCRDAVILAAEVREAYQTTTLVQNAITSGTYASVRDELPAVLREQAGRLEQVTGGNADALLDAHKVDADNPPPKPVPIYTLNGETLCTQGNIGQLQSQAKQGKTAVFGAMVAAALSDNFGNDTFGFASDPDRQGAILVFDCEQSSYKAHSVISVALRRAGINRHPQRLRVYSFVGIPRNKRLGLMVREFERAVKECGSIHSAFLDGYADFCHDPNNPDEAFPFVEEMHARAEHYSTVIMGVLHENPGTQFNKSRGHLGSELQRKCEANLILSKDPDDVSEIYAPACRECSIQKGKGPRFKYDAATGMHVSCEPAENQKKREDREGMQAAVDEAFEDAPVLRNSELIHAIMRIRKVKNNAAGNYLNKLLQANFIRKNEQKFYTKAA